MKLDMVSAVVAVLAILNEMKGRELNDSEFDFYQNRIREILLEGLDKL